MRKTVFFGFGILITVAVLYWIDGFYALSPEKRIGFLNYVQNDISQKFGQTKTNLENLPDTFMEISKGKKSMQEILIAQIQKTLEMYYVSSGKYPEKLDQIMRLDALPKDLRLEYKQQGDGYILRLIDKNGKILQEVAM